MQKVAGLELWVYKLKVRPGSKKVDLSPVTCLDAEGRKKLETWKGVKERDS